MTEFESFIHEHSLSHYKVLKQDIGFPNNCVYSSQLFGSYWISRFPDLSIVYGTFGSNYLFHAWVSLRDMIIDFTRFQFFAYKEKRSFYLKLSELDLLSYILQFQSSLVLTEDTPFYFSYNPLTLVKPELIPTSTESYEDFLFRIVTTSEAQEMKWLNSLTFDGRKFSVWLDDNQLRVTKRYVSKFAIVSK